VSAAQAVQLEEFDAPTVERCLPAAQLMQEDKPTISAYLPAAQFEQDGRPEIAENFPTGQSKHADEPVVLTYVPVSQGVQVVPFIAYFPTTQDTQADERAAPDGLALPSAQAVQSEAATEEE